MAKIKEILAKLRPYVTGVRYVESIPIIDVTFKDGWTVPKSKVISNERGEENKNYYMFYSDKEGIGFDEILDFVKSVINLNVERELKHALLIEKVDELKKIFKEKSLAELKSLRFSFGTDKLVPEIMEEDEFLDTELMVNTPILESKQEPVKQESVKQESVKQESVKQESVKQEPQQPIDGEPPLVSEIEGEFEKFTLSDTIELPPKKNGKVIVNEVAIKKETCNCGPEDICPVCAESKGF